MKTVTDDLQKEMKQAGVNIAKGLTAGMESETRNLSKSMKKICQNIIKTAKKTLKIHSPSREFAKIGSRDIQGANKGHEKEAPNLYKQMGTISLVTSRPSIISGTSIRSGPVKTIDSDPLA